MLVYVCLDADDDALSEGLAMAHSLVSRRGHVVVCMRESSPFAGVLAARSGLIDDVMGRLSVFGVIEEACVPSNIRDDFTEQLARSIHRAYVAMETANGKTPATNPSMVPWESLSEDLRRSNIAQAVDIGDKMDAIGAIIVPESADVPEFHFTDGEVERLAVQEHERWMRDRLSQGWRYGQTRNNERKIHPDLQPWAALSAADKDKDRNAIRTLPETLRDAGFQILRLPPDSWGLAAPVRHVSRKPPVRIGELDRPALDQLGVGRVVVHLLVAEHEGRTAWRPLAQQRDGYARG